MPNVATIYSKFRGSKGFLIGLATFIGLWMTFHFLFGFDTDFGDLNTILSTEASVSLAFFTMVSDKQASIEKLIIEEIRRIGASTLEIAIAQRAVTELIIKKLDQILEKVEN